MSTYDFAFETKEEITIQGDFTIDSDGDSIELVFDNWTTKIDTVIITTNKPIFVKGDFVLHKRDNRFYIVGKVYKKDDSFHDIDDRFVTIRGEEHNEEDDDEVEETVEDELERQLGHLFVPDEEHNEEDDDWGGDGEGDDVNSVLT